MFENVLFYTSKLSKEFGGIQKNFEEAKFIILGIPYDSTSTYRTGSRFAPSVIREASFNVETNGILSNDFLENVKFYDLGDLEVLGIEIKEALRRISLVIEELVEGNKIPVCIGGEHTITYGILRSIKSIDTLVIFDAHLDLRDEYPFGIKYGHATVFRRVYEDFRIPKIIYIGSRAWSKEEISYLKKHENFKLITSFEIINNLKDAINRLKTFVSDSKNVYLSIDVDVFDISQAPGVSNPEAFGIFYNDFINMLKIILDLKILGIDLVEVCPNYDNGITSILASKILIECLTYLSNKLS